MNDTVLPNWVIEVKIEPKLESDSGRLVSALAQIASEDRSFGYSKDPETNKLIIMGLDELSLDTQIGVLQRVHKIDVSVGALQVRYREMLVRSADCDYTHKKQSRATGQFARVKLRIEPNRHGTGNKFMSEIVGDAVPEEFISAVMRGVQSVWESCVLTGFPMVDTEVTRHDGAYHDVDSSAISFEIAARMAMREGATKAGVKLLEPIMDIEVATPLNVVGNVIGDIKRRRGQIRAESSQVDLYPA